MLTGTLRCRKHHQFPLEKSVPVAAVPVLMMTAGVEIVLQHLHGCRLQISEPALVLPTAAADLQMFHAQVAAGTLTDYGRQLELLEPAPVLPAAAADLQMFMPKLLLGH